MIKTNKVKVPKFIYEWLEDEYKQWHFKETKDRGNFIFRVVQDMIKESNEMLTWGDFNINDEVLKWVLL